jgi:hypothetical protein
MDELQRKASSIGWESDSRKDGTAMTRLYQELIWIIAENGPLYAMSQVINQLIDNLNKEEGFRKDQAINAINALKNSKKNWD